jgi:hypothetical protein
MNGGKAMRRRGIVGLVLVLAGAGASWAADAGKAAPGPDGKAALERIKSLAGQWRGHVVTKDGPPGEVVYSVTAGGSTVVEKLFPGTGHEMVSMYHLDGADLVLTHYCAMGNQPRMRLVKASGTDPLELRFDFAGGDNIDPAKDMHMHAGTMTRRGADRLEAEWAVWDKGAPAGANRFFLDRVKGAADRRP